MRKSVTTVYHDVLFGGSRTVDGERRVDVILSGVTRRTVRANEVFTRKLWAAMGGDPDRLEQVPPAELQRFAKTRAGRYDRLEVTVYDDDTYSYVTSSSGGGDFPLADLAHWDYRTGDLTCVPSPLDGQD